jgi:hypothetical protein
VRLILKLSSNNVLQRPGPVGDANTRANCAGAEAGEAARVQLGAVLPRPGPAARGPPLRIQAHVLQCAVYDSDKPSARLIGTTHLRPSRPLVLAPVRSTVTKVRFTVLSTFTLSLAGVEYIVSDANFEGLPQEEQRLWHSHAYEVKAGLWTPEEGISIT